MYPPVQGSARLRVRPRRGLLVRVAGPLSSSSRWIAHLAVLLVLGLASLPSAPLILGQNDPSGTQQLLRGSAADRQSRPRRSGGLFESAPPALAPTPAPSPTPILPAWFQAHRSTPLWSSPEADGPQVADVAQWRRLHPLGPRSGGRFLVEDPGDGFARFPSRGWVNAADVGPAGPPEVEWELGLHPDVSGAPEWQGDAWPQGITAEFVVVLDGLSGQLLYGKNAHGRVAPASLTKIVTAIVALERSSLSDTVLVDVDGSAMLESTVMGIRPGQYISLKTLLYGLMLPSGNDAALAIAQHVGGSEAGFVDLMNQLVARLELEDTHFANSHGLDAPGHVSSPYDMAVLARYGMRNPDFAQLSAARHYEGEGYSLWNLNRLLGLYEGADGVKPGFTDLAGRALVGSATRDGHRVFVTLMRSPDLWGDAVGLLNYAFRNFRWAK